MSEAEARMVVERLVPIIRDFLAPAAAAPSAAAR